MTIYPHFYFEATNLYSKKEEEFLEQRSMENLVETYREELLKVLRGYNCVDFMSLSVRRRMKEYGILKQFSGRYTVTKLGLKMIEASDRVVQQRGGGEG